MGLQGVQETFSISILFVSFYWTYAHSKLFSWLCASLIKIKMAAKSVPWFASSILQAIKYANCEVKPDFEFQATQ